MSAVHSDYPWWGQPERDAGDAFTGFWHHLGWYAALPIESLTLKRKGSGWLLTVNARSAHRGALVCFTEGRTPGDCWGNLIYQAGHGKGLDWKPDRYAK